MTIANELSFEIANALLVNRSGDPAELLRIVKQCHLELRRLSFGESLGGPEQPGKSQPEDSVKVTLRAVEDDDLLTFNDALNVESFSSLSKSSQWLHD